jgi:hypothetical protein
LRKLQQFYIGKFLSGRLANDNFDIKRGAFLDKNDCERKAPTNSSILSSLRSKQELVALADSQVLRTIRMIKYNRLKEQNEHFVEYNKEQLEWLIKQKKRLLKTEPQSRAEKNALGSEIKQVNNKINDMLYIPEYILVTIEQDSHYRTMIRKGLFINGRKYVRLLCSAGMARNNTVAFIEESYEEELKRYLRNGVKDVKITKNKYNAYFALASTATHILSTPKVLLIDDCEINMTKKIDWVQDTQTIDPLKNKQRIITLDKELSFNLFDGGGLVDISKAKKWAEELELDYIPSVFIIRNIFCKGCLFTVDFRKFGREVAKREVVKDAFGNEQRIEECDVILTKSQFKLSAGYDSMEDYQKKCDENFNYWGTSRVSPKKDDDFFFTNYQFLQVLDLNEDNIKELCKPTIDWLTGVAGLDRNFALLYLLGGLCLKEDLEPQEIINLTSDNMVKALIINKEMINDEYIRSTIIQSINKKIKEAYIGKLIVEGCFNTMIPDPYALMEWVFADGDVSKVHGLLNEFEHYSAYWNKRGKQEAVGMRSPLTWRSEVNKLIFIDNEQTREWYQYLDSGTIYNVWGVDCILHADSDFDGDIVATAANDVFVNSRYGEALGITYEKKTVPKEIIQEKDLYKADLDSFDTTIGTVTNYSTSDYELLYKYIGKTDDYSKKCYDEIIERLKLTRKEQGNAIDAAKGIKVDPYPQIWTKRQKITSEDTEEVIEQKLFLNDVCADRKPYFFKYRYPTSNREYEEYVTAKEFYCRATFNKNLNDILEVDEEQLNEEEKEFKKSYYEFCPLINYQGPMNKVCNYLEKELSLIKILKKEKTPENVIKLMQTEDKKIDEFDLEKIKEFYERYTCKKRDLKMQQIYAVKSISQKMVNTEDNIVNIEQYAKKLRAEAEEYFMKNCVIGKTVSEMIADTVVEFCYIRYTSKSKAFAWNVFGKYILENIKKNTLKETNKTTIPYLDKDGDIEYLYNKFSEIKIDILSPQEAKEEDKNDI